VDLLIGERVAVLLCGCRADLDGKRPHDGREGRLGPTALRHRAPDGRLVWGWLGVELGTGEACRALTVKRAG
jgi:hypothetical protein